MSKNNKIFIVSHDIPPIVSPRSIQLSRLFGALAKQGWTLEVYAAQIDPKTHPTAIFDYDLAKRHSSSFSTHFITKKNTPLSLWAQVKKRLGRPVEWLWDAAVRDRILAKIHKSTPSMLLTFGQPFIDHYVGVQIKNRFPELPWLAHFSDPWVDNPYSVTTDFDIQTERLVVEKSDALVFTTTRTQELVMKKYPEKWIRKTHVIPHGFEKEALSLPNKDLPDKTLHLLHTGNIYEARAPFVLIFALLMLREREVTDIKIHFIGHVQPVFSKLVEGYGLSSYFSFLGSIKPDACLEKAASSDVLLVCDAPSKESVFLPSKVVDYLTARRPILAITPTESSTTDFLRDVNGITASPDSPEKLADILVKLLEMKKDNQLSSLLPNDSAVEKYMIDTCAQHFSKIMNSIAAD